MKKYKFLIKKINLYPPFLFSGIRARALNDDFTAFESSLGQHWFNKNLFGTAFGGSLYAMCDPFYAFILIANLGKGYIVWDKSASITFKKPGKGKVKAIFEIGKEELARIQSEVNELGKKTFHFNTVITNDAGEIVAEVEKELYVRKK